MDVTVDRSVDVSDPIMMLEKLLLEQVSAQSEGVYEYRGNPNENEELRLTFGMVTRSVTGMMRVSNLDFRFEQEGLESVDAVSKGGIHYAVLIFEQKGWMTRTFVQTHPHLGLDTASLEGKASDVDYDPLQYLERAKSKLD